MDEQTVGWGIPVSYVEVPYRDNQKMRKDRSVLIDVFGDHGTG